MDGFIDEFDSAYLRTAHLQYDLDLEQFIGFVVVRLLVSLEYCYLVVLLSPIFEINFYSLRKHIKKMAKLRAELETIGDNNLAMLFDEFMGVSYFHWNQRTAYSHQLRLSIIQEVGGKEREGEGKTWGNSHFIFMNLWEFHFNYVILFSHHITTHTTVKNCLPRVQNFC